MTEDRVSLESRSSAEKAWISSGDFFMSSVSDDVAKQVARLGGVFCVNVNDDRNAKGLPASVRALLLGIAWPKDKTFLNDEAMGDHHVWGVDFISQPWDSVDFGELGQNKSLFLFGIADGGNYLIALSLEEAGVGDPNLYVIDHEANSPEDLSSPIPLSEFLKSLLPEA